MVTDKESAAMNVPSIVYFLNGPNANLYGLDRNGTYGRESFVSIRRRCEDHAASLGLTLEFRQSNHEGVLVDWIVSPSAIIPTSRARLPASLPDWAHWATSWR